MLREAVREHLRRELVIDEKFGHFTAVKEKELEDYYLDPVPSQEECPEEKIATHLKTWLQQMRKATKIKIFPLRPSLAKVENNGESLRLP